MHISPIPLNLYTNPKCVPRNMKNWVWEANWVWEVPHWGWWWCRVLLKHATQNICIPCACSRHTLLTSRNHAIIFYMLPHIQLNNLFWDLSKYGLQAKQYTVFWILLSPFFKQKNTEHLISWTHHPFSRCSQKSKKMDLSIHLQVLKGPWDMLRVWCWFFQFSKQ